MASILKVTEITTPDGTGNITVSRPLTGGTGVKGGDIASASPLVIDTDGDYFDVTGTTNFAAMTVAADRQFTLQFDGALTMTHHATNLDLPSEANITTAAGDVAVFQSTGSNTVQCINYMRADGTGIAGGGDFSDGGDAGGAARTLGNTDAYDFALKTNNVEQLKIEGDTNAGIIDMPNQSGCYVTRNTEQTLTTSTVTKIEFATEAYDIQNEFDSTTNYRFTATKAGNYLICVQLYYYQVSDGTGCQIYIHKNGARASATITKSGTSQSPTAAFCFDLAASDYIEINGAHYEGSDAAILGGFNYNKLTINKIA
jgi:hypothetical protein